MNGNGEGEVLVAFKSEELGGNGEMATAGNREVFCESLNESQDKCLYFVHRNELSD